MRNRQKQRALRGSGKREESISKRNSSWAVDLTPYEAIEKLIEEKKKAIIEEQRLRNGIKGQ